MDRPGGLVVIAPAHRAGDLGSNPGPARILSLKLTEWDDTDCIDNSWGSRIIDWKNKELNWKSGMKKLKEAIKG